MLTPADLAEIRVRHAGALEWGDCALCSLLDHVAALEAALRALVGGGDGAIEEFDWGEPALLCPHCEGPDPPEGQTFVHTPDCPWLAARAMVGQPARPAQFPDQLRPELTAEPAP